MGSLLGLMTHHVDRIGHLIWLAESFFDEVPTVEDVEGIDRWRGPILFPLGAAIHRKIATRIGRVEIPSAYARAGVPWLEWQRRIDTVILDVARSSSSPGGPTTDRSLPIYSVVNDTRLKEMLVSGWMPNDRW